LCRVICRRWLVCGRNPLIADKRKLNGGPVGRLKGRVDEAFPGRGEKAAR